MKLRERYEVLDGLRGVAAIGVMLFHFSIIGGSFASHGYLAVDFFFVLSGFVMSHAYSKRLDDIGFNSFLRQRLIRILPLSTIGLLAGTLYFVLRYYSQNQSLYDIYDILVGTAFNIFLIPKPWMTSVPTDTIFTTNTPLWSLSLEMILNLVWAWALYRSRFSLIMLVVSLSAIGLILMIFYNGTADFGATWPTYLGGVLRATFGFLGGTLIWRYRPNPNNTGPYPEIAGLLLIAVLFFPYMWPAFDVVSIVFIFPAIIYISSLADLRLERPAYRFLGQLSYPLYVIHVPILHFIVGFVKTTGLQNKAHLIYILAFALCISTSIILDRLFDRPVRRLLTQRLTPSSI